MYVDLPLDTKERIVAIVKYNTVTVPSIHPPLTQMVLADTQIEQDIDNYVVFILPFACVWYLSALIVCILTSFTLKGRTIEID
jgi:hypothetical protein